MNTTFDSQTKYRSLTERVGEHVRRWKRSQPTLGVVADAVKSWQHELGQICMDERYQVTSTRNADLALDEAWHNRDNMRHALKAVEEAWEEMSKTEEALKADRHVPIHQQRNRAEHLNQSSIKGLVDFEGPSPKQVMSENSVKAWVDAARKHLDEIHFVPQNNRQYLSANPTLEGRVYESAAVRAKAWFEEQQGIASVITAKSWNELQNVQACLDVVAQVGSVGWLDNGSRREIHSALRAATKSLNNVQPVVRTAQVKSNLFSDVAGVRNALDNMMPLVQSGQYDDADLYSEVTNSIAQVRALAQVLPIKMLPQDTMDNLQNANLSLEQMITSRNHAVRIKSLRAAAANMDVIANDLAELEQNMADPY